MSGKRLRILALFGCLVLLGGIALALTVAADGESRTIATPCGRIAADKAATTQLHVVGNQMQDDLGNAFVPYGISVVSGPETTNWMLSEKAVHAQIVASRRYWHANSVRIQISQSLIWAKPTKGRSYNTKFVASVDRLVCAAIKQGQVVIINDNSIFTGARRGPTELTKRFWEFFSRRYGNKLPVIFDLYNEPQVVRSDKSGRFLTPQKAWDVWRDGGRVGGQEYLGMQDLVDTIRRKHHVKNVIWAEQPYYTDLKRTRLDLLETHLLTGDDIVYAFHKLLMSDSDTSSKAVESLTKKGVPLVTSEWTQFAADDRPWMCQPNSYKTTPGYLDYLTQHKIGLIAWSLQPGVLVKGIDGVDTVHDGNDYRYTSDPTKLQEPSVMKPSYGCTKKARGQGAGKLVQDLFARQSARASAALFPQFD